MYIFKFIFHIMELFGFTNEVICFEKKQTLY